MTRKYAYPPIREAVCEFRFQSGSPFDISVPGLVYNELSDEFPDRLRRPSNAGQISVSISGDALQNLPGGRLEEVIRHGQDLRFWREGRKDGLIVLSQNRLAVSHYKPYRSWQDFRPDIAQAYRAYNNHANPESIQRIGLRYINEIIFNQERVDPKDYFNIYPYLGAALPQDYAGLDMSLQIPFEATRDRLRLRLATRFEIDSSDDVTIFAELDLDYSLAIPGSVPLEHAVDWLDVAHRHIVETFEGCLTDEVRVKFNKEGT